MKLEDLKGLRRGEIVVITKVDENISEYNEYLLGDELIFIDILKVCEDGRDMVNFNRRSRNFNHKLDTIICNFSYEICNYIERKTILERGRFKYSL